MTTRIRAGLMSALAVALVVTGGCSSDDSGDGGDAAGGSAATTTTEAVTAPTTVNVTGTDYAYALDTETVAAGLVTVNLANEGEEAHQITLMRLENGQTTTDVVEGLQGPDGDHFVADDAYAGGPTNTLPGDQGSVTVALTEGAYTMVCFIASPDGESHFVKGMAGALEVVDTEAAPIEPPEATATVHMSDFTYDIPADLPGEGVIEVVNDGPQVHELTISAPDLSAGSGLAGIAPGATAYLPVDLDPGSYNFVCFVSDQDSGDPHFALGMNVDVTISGGGGGGSGGTTTTTG